MIKKIIGVPGCKDLRFKSWARALERVDRSKTTATAFKGQDLPLRGVVELDVGTFVLLYEEQGSRRSRRVYITLFVVGSDRFSRIKTWGPLSLRGWVKDVRDEIADIVESKLSSLVVSEPKLVLTGELKDVEGNLWTFESYRNEYGDVIVGIKLYYKDYEEPLLMRMSIGSFKALMSNIIEAWEQRGCEDKNSCS